MARARDGTTDVIGKPALARPPTYQISNTSAAWSGTIADSGKNRLNSTVTFADSVQRTSDRNVGERSQSNVINEPLLSMTKHKGLYGIKMNPMPYRDQDGEWVRPKNIDPVNIKLGRRGNRDPTISSQSSIDIDLAPQYAKSTKQK